MKEKTFNPEKYIKSRARKLRIHACYINRDWKKSKMANLVVVRQHHDGNYSIGIYLVDLLCLGVKDCFFVFNIDESEYREFLLGLDENSLKGLRKISYNKAHNIIFSGYEFALDNGIKPNVDFERYMLYFLEKDDDRIPLIDIECGENGIPHYFQTPSENGSFAGEIIRALEENLGNGNFYVTLLGDEKEEFPDPVNNHPPLFPESPEN